MAFRAPLRLVAAARPTATRLSFRAASRPAYRAASTAVPNPDPSEGSPSARLVAEHAPFMVATYARPPPVFVKGEGSYLWDVEDRKYLDFTAGIAVNSLGHCDPEMSKLIEEQVRILPFISNNPVINTHSY